MYKRNMKMFKQIWNKIDSILHSESSKAKDGGYKTNDAQTSEGSVQTPAYSETIDGVAYVTKENAIKLLKDKKDILPSPELKKAVKDTMFDYLAGSGYDNQKETLSNVFSSNEISELIGSRKDSQTITDNADEKEKFMKDAGVQTRPSKEVLNKTKKDIKDKIPSQQAARSKAIKKKKASTTAAKMRKNK